MAELSYARNGEYQIPTLQMADLKGKPLGKYGRLRRSYLEEHRPVLFTSLLRSEKLYPHLHEITQMTNSRLEQMMPHLIKAAGITESLKSIDPMQWVRRMNNCKAQAEETILQELICSQIKDICRFKH